MDTQVRWTLEQDGHILAMTLEKMDTQARWTLEQDGHLSKMDT